MRGPKPKPLFVELIALPPMVYRLLDIEGKTLYIGSTMNIYGRLRQHISSKYDTKQFYKVLVHRCYSLEEARELEEYSIYEEQPPLNIKRTMPRRRTKLKAHKRSPRRKTDTNPY